MTISKQGWTEPTSTAEANARAGGRARYNGWRQTRAKLRQAEVARLIAEMGGLHPGVQAAVARRLGVNESTISRDIRAIFNGARPRECPFCGCAEADHRWRWPE